eukprot:4584307-Prymnesium_polylepis.1
MNTGALWTRWRSARATGRRRRSPRASGTAATSCRVPECAGCEQTQWIRRASPLASRCFLVRTLISQRASPSRPDACLLYTSDAADDM